MKVIDAAEKAGLIHSVYNNSAMPNAVCKCRADRYIFYYSPARYGILEERRGQEQISGAAGQSSLQRMQTSVERNIFGAAEMVKGAGDKKLKAEANPDKCFGCKVCAVGCESQGIRLWEARSPEPTTA